MGNKTVHTVLYLPTRRTARCREPQEFPSRKYSKHKASGQAVVTIGGHYLGPHGTKASLIEYDRLIAEWMVNGRQLRVTADAGLLVAELIKRYREHVRQHYVENGKPTSEQHDIACALRFVRELYHGELVTDFGPLALKAVRHKMVEASHRAPHC